MSTRTSRVKYLKIHNSFSQSKKATVLEHIAPIYSIVVILHACVNECASMIGLIRLDLSFLEALV
jgi:hypothetical protein